MRGAVHMQITTIGLDIAKNVFQVLADETEKWRKAPIERIRRLFQTLNSMSPFRSFWSASGILIPKQANFVHRIFERNSLGPFDWNEILHLLRIGYVSAVIFRTAQSLGRQLLFTVDHNPEVRRRGDVPLDVEVLRADVA
jgi:hypothetical protein